MIKIFAGLQGAGKTRNLIDLANAEAKSSSGNLVYVDADQSHILQLEHAIRLIQVSDFSLDNPGEFFGFVCGILSQDYDLATIYIDGLLKNAKADLSTVETLVSKIVAVSERFNVNFVISMCVEPSALPASVQQYLA